MSSVESQLLATKLDWGNVLKLLERTNWSQ